MARGNASTALTSAERDPFLKHFRYSLDARRDLAPACPSPKHQREGSKDDNEHGQHDSSCRPIGTNINRAAGDLILANHRPETKNSRWMQIDRDSFQNLRLRSIPNGPTPMRWS